MGDNIKVVARFRPINARERAEGDGPSRIVVDFDAQNTVSLENHLNPEAKKHTFNFDCVVPPDWSQQQVYETTTKHILNDLFNGINSAAIFYGQTGAGKTHTSFGGKTPESRGIVPRLTDDIFNRIAETPDVEFTVKVSYVEIYNESIRDLLDSTKVDLKVRSSGNAVWIDGVTQEYVQTAEEIQAVINRGASNRAVASTLMNAESSRSHSIVLVTIGQKSARGITGAKVTIVDLAGSERVSKTQVSGAQLKEAQSINRSLSALGNVINALSTPPKKGEKNFVPYRDSKLTWLLSDCLGGSSKCIMFIAASPCYFNLPETYSTALFGQRCKKIANKVVVNQHLSEAEYQRLLELKDKHIMTLASILGDIYQKLTTTFGNVSHVDLDSNTGLPPALSSYQRGQIAHSKDPAKHETWNQFTGEYQSPEFDVPVLVTAIQDKQDLEKLFEKLNTDNLSTLSPALSTPLPPPPTSYLSIDPAVDLPPESDMYPHDESMMSPNEIPELMSPVPNDDDGEMINLDNVDSEFLDKQFQDVKVNEALQASTSSTALNTTGGPHAPGLVTTRDRSGSVELSSGQLKLFTTGGGSEAAPSSPATPTDQVLSLLRSHFNKNTDKTQEILDTLLATANNVDDIAAKVLLSLTNQQPPAAKKKIIKKKAAPSATATDETTTQDPQHDDEKEQEHDQDDHAHEQQEEQKESEEKKTGGKKVVKKIVKKVVKKSTETKTAAAPAPAAATTEDIVLVPSEQPVDDAKVQEEQVVVKEEEPQEEQKQPQEPEPEPEVVEPLVQSVISDDIFANTATANFATYSPHTSDTEGETPLPDQNLQTTKIVFDDDQDDFTTSLPEQPVTTIADDSDVAQHGGADERDILEAALRARDEETQLEVQTLKNNVDDLQRQLEETQLYIKSLKLQNDLLKEQQEDLENQVATAAHKTQLNPQQQQIQFDIKEKQLTVQNDALSIALERKCRDLIKSEVRLSSCVYHIERLEEAYQTVGQEKTELAEKLAQSQHQVTSVHSLSQQLLKTAQYWRSRAEKAEDTIKAGHTVTGGSALPKATVGATLPAKPAPQRTYQPPPTKATMSQYTKTAEMKPFF